MNARFNRLTYILPLCIAAKIIVDTGQQIFRPFLPIFAEGIGTGVVEFGGILAVSSMMGLGAPLIGHLSDKFGFRSVLRISLIAVGLSFITLAAFPSPWVMTVLILIIGLGGASFAPTLHAYISTRLPYEKRGRGIATLEFSFAFSSIFGLLAAGYLIEHISWKAPFYFMGITMIILSFTFLLLPKVEKPLHAELEEKKKKTEAPILKQIISFLDLGSNSRSAWANIIFNSFIYFALSNITIIQGVWLREKYGAGPALIGRISSIMGIFDLAGCILVALFVDRIGKKKSVVMGTAGAVMAYALFPVLDFSLITAVISLLLIRIFFEYTLVSNFSLLSEQVPEQRGKVMGLSIAFGYSANAVGNITGPTAYLKSGTWGIGPVSLAASLLALAIVVFFVRESITSNDRNK